MSEVSKPELQNPPPDDTKVLLCAMNEEGLVVASMRVSPTDQAVEAARNVMLAVSPVVHEKLVCKGRSGGR